VEDEGFMGAIATYRGLLSNRPLVRLLAGEFVSGIGDWLYLVALLVIVYRESDGDPVLLGIIGGARIIPYIVLSVPAGMVADRFDRKMILLSTDIVRGVIMVVLALLVMADGPLLLIVGLAIFATCFSSFFHPAIGAYMPMLARNERELGPANSAFATLGEISFILGPAVSGIIIATADLEWAFIINAVTFGFVALMLLGLPSGRPGETPGADLARRQAAAGEPVPAPVAGPTGDLASTDEAESAATTTGSPGAGDEPAAKERPEKVPLMTALRPVMRPFAGLVVLDLVSGFMFGGISVLTVILAVGRLGEPEAATGFLNAAIGVGGVIGAVASGAIVLRANLAPPLFVGAAVLGVGFLILAVAEVLSLSLVSMAVIAGGALLAGVVGETVFQRVVPDSIRGRALGIWMTLSTLMYAAGAFLTPILVTELGFWVLAVGGFAIIAAGVVAVVLVGPDLRRAPDAGVETLRRVSRLPLFAGVPPAALEATANRLIQVPVTAGEVVIRQGEPADRFFIIESGQFAVDQHDAATGETRRLRVMGPDDVFGELGLMHHAPRSATITAETDGHLLALEGTDFLELLNVGPSLSGRLLERYGGASVAPPT
jgi:MFS family permease